MMQRFILLIAICVAAVSADNNAAHSTKISSNHHHQQRRELTSFSFTNIWGNFLNHLCGPNEHDDCHGIQHVNPCCHVSTHHSSSHHSSSGGGISSSSSGGSSGGGDDHTDDWSGDDHTDDWGGDDHDDKWGGDDHAEATEWGDDGHDDNEWNDDGHDDDKYWYGDDHDDDQWENDGYWASANSANYDAGGTTMKTKLLWGFGAVALLFVGLIAVVRRRRNKSREEVPDNVYIESGDGPIGTHDNVESGEGASSGGSVNSRSRAASIKSKFSAFGGSIKSKFSRNRSGNDQYDEQDGYTNADGVYM